MKQSHRNIPVHAGQRYDNLSLANKFYASRVYSRCSCNNKYLARVLIKALKAHAKENPDQRASAVAEIKLFRNPKTKAEALSTPERQHWIDDINKEMKSLIDKDTYEVKKLLPGRKPIASVLPTRLVLAIKLQSDGSIDKFKARFVDSHSKCAVCKPG